MPPAPYLQILVADRHRSVAQALARVIAATGARVACIARTGEELVEGLMRIRPDIAIVDLELTPDPRMLPTLHRLCPNTRIIAMVERDDHSARDLVAALAAGAVGAILSEATLEDLERALSSASQSSPVVAAEATGVLLDSYVASLSNKRQRDLATIEALAAAVEARDFGTGRHHQRVARLATDCLNTIDGALARNEEVGYGFMLHDVGKIGIADAILNKPGPLRDEEWAIMRRHPELGVKIAAPIGFSQDTTDVILYHHERWDGGGYPDGLAGGDIPVVARVFAVADAYDAMTSDRPYRRAMGVRPALEHIGHHAGRSFDPEVVEVFLELVG